MGPLSKEERADQPTAFSPILSRYEATVRAVEAERDVLAERVKRLREALDGVIGWVSVYDDNMAPGDFDKRDRAMNDAFEAIRLSYIHGEGQ